MKNVKNADKKIYQLNKKERSVLSKNLRKGWHFKPGNVYKNFYRKLGDLEPQIYVNINIEKVANKVHSRFGIELLECHVLEDTGLPIKESHLGKGKYWTVLQAKRKIDELMHKIDNACKNWFYCAWDNQIDGIKWFRWEKEVLEKERSGSRGSVREK